MWLSLVERCVRDAKAAGSNPVIPTSINNQPIEISTFQWVFWALLKMGSVKNVGVEDTPRISEPLSFFEKTLFSSAPTGVSHR